MNGRERVQRVLKGVPVDRVPRGEILIEDRWFLDEGFSSLVEVLERLGSYQGLSWEAVQAVYAAASIWRRKAVETIS